MAIALVTGQLAVTDVSSSGTTLSIAFPGNVTAGNLLVAGTSNDAAANASRTISDTLSTTWNSSVIDADNATIGQRSTGHYAKNIASGGACTVTCTWGLAEDFRSLHIAEFSGADTSAPLDQTSAGTGNGTPSSGAKTTTTNGQLIYGMDGNVATGVGSGFTALTSGSAYNNRDEYQIQSSAGSISADFTGSGQYCTVMMTFKAASAGGGAVQRNLSLLGVGLAVRLVAASRLRDLLTRRDAFKMLAALIMPWKTR